MIKWEYCALFLLLESGKAQLETYKSGQMDKVIAVDFNQVMAELGLNGWEMVTSVYVPDPPGPLAHTFYFKRPVN